MKRILVTGAHGQLGSELRELADDADDLQFFFTDHDTLDITDRNAVCHFVENNSIETIVNCAAFTAVDKAEGEPEAANLVNNIAAGYLASAAAMIGGGMIQISTDYVFDGNASVPYREDTSTNPKSVYGETKLKGEESVIRNCPGAMVIRTSWLYSSFGNNFVKTMIRLGKERSGLNVVADQVGTPTYARDLAVAIVAVIRHGIVPGIFHFSNEGACSWYDFAKAIHRAKGIDDDDCHVSPITSEEYPVAAKRPHYSVLDKRKIKDTYDIQIPWWEDSLKDCIKKL